MKRHASLVLRMGLYFCTALLTLSACTESVHPIIGDERPFTIYGFLDPTTSEQYLRVVPVSEDFSTVSSQDVDAQVHTIDLTTNERVAWTKQRILFPDSTEGYVFAAQFTPIVARSYRLEVENSEGERVSAVTTVPPVISINRMATSSQLNPLFIIEADEFPNIVQADFVYEVVALQPSMSARANYTLEIPVSYRGTESASDGGWRIQTRMQNDFEQVKEAFASICIITDFLGLRSVNFEFFIGDDSWVPPGGEFVRDILLQPGSFSNVENGYGYFGSGYAVTFSIPLTSTERGLVGYALDPPCQAGPGFDPSVPECRELNACL